MSIIALILVIIPPQVPGMQSIERVSNDPLTKAATYSLGSQSGMSVISNDGKAVFVNEGRIGHYFFGNPAFAKLEDIFYFNIDGNPVSLTTSQYSHVYDDIKAQSLGKDTRDVFAANAKKMFVGTKLNDVLRLTIVNLAKRGHRPNDDTDLRPKFESAPILMRVNIEGPTPKWYVCHVAWQPSTPNKPSVIEEVRFSGGRASARRLGICAPGGFSDFDPKSKLLLSNSSSHVIIGRLGTTTAIKTAQPEQPEGVGMNAFLWHGKVMAQTDRLYVRDSDRKWKPFGSSFRCSPRAPTKSTG